MTLPADTNDIATRFDCLEFSELTTPLLYRMLKLRQEVFIVEQNCVYCDLDDLDQPAWHILARRADHLLACLRCLPPGVVYEESALGRIAVSPEARGQQLGRKIVQQGIEFCRERWPGTGIRISAQQYLEKFYREFGFVTDSDVYDEDGIPHIKMVLGNSS